MTDDKKEIEKLKRSDQAAFTYTRSKVRKTAEFTSADAETQHQLLATIVETCKKGRYVIVIYIVISILIFK